MNYIKIYEQNDKKDGEGKFFYVDGSRYEGKLILI